jgi:hypothetical protein
LYTALLYLDNCTATLTKCVAHGNIVYAAFILLYLGVSKYKLGKFASLSLSPVLTPFIFHDLYIDLNILVT